jgi:hypothetical protein
MNHCSCDVGQLTYTYYAGQRLHVRREGCGFTQEISLCKGKSKLRTHVGFLGSFDPFRNGGDTILAHDP